MDTMATAQSEDATNTSTNLDKALNNMVHTCTHSYKQYMVMKTVLTNRMKIAEGATTKTDHDKEILKNLPDLLKKPLTELATCRLSTETGVSKQHTFLDAPAGFHDNYFDDVPYFDTCAAGDSYTNFDRCQSPQYWSSL